MYGSRMFAVIAGVLLTASPSPGATHKGMCLDHKEYAATARCVTTDQVFEQVFVKFDRDTANLYFDDGGHLILKLESEEIDDPGHLVSHVIGKGYEGITWVLQLSWKDDTPPPKQTPDQPH